MQSILDGHGVTVDEGGWPIPPPAEWTDFCLMHEMHWTWGDLTGDPGEPPWYVQRFCLDFLGLIAEARSRRR